MQFFTSILPWIQVILSVTVIALVLLQQSEAGLGTGFGGSGDVIKHTRRGLEKHLFYATIVTASLFALASFLAFWLK